MSTTIESILAVPDKKKATEYNIITAMRDIWRGYEELKSTVGGGGKKTYNKSRKKSIIIGWQITKDGEDREKGRIEKRKAD